MSADPFVNSPHLREKLIPADKSTLRLTPEALAAWDQLAKDLEFVEVLQGINLQHLFGFSDFDRDEPAVFEAYQDASR